MSADDDKTNTSSTIIDKTNSESLDKSLGLPSKTP